MPRPVNMKWTTTRSFDSVRGWVSTSLADVLRRSGYRSTSDTPTELVLTHPASSRWSVLPFSLVAFLLAPEREYQVVFRFGRLPDGRTEMLTIGDLPNRVITVLEGLPNT
ncbi:hypothetical protein ABLG96_13480 [Nakamurella sp. A5-74]|uniref:Uncharacterized protein n=1 Tax=Nakamurella sp. A5-74 TaxID=3158264 RepID=A0AAU8DJF6_9ACTN